MVLDLSNIGTILVSVAVFAFIVWLFVAGFKENSRQAGTDKNKKSGKSNNTTDTKSGE